MKRLSLNWQSKLAFAAAMIGLFLFGANIWAIAQEDWERGDEWRGQYTVGGKVPFSISGNASDYQTCTVTENSPQGVMRVKCEAFKQWTAGNYIVYGKGNIRPKQSATTVSNSQTQNGNETQTKWDNGDEWRGEFKAGDKIQFSISGKATDLQTCTVTENDPQAVMRVKCDAFKQWKAGTYIVYSESNVRPTKTKQAIEDSNKKTTKQPGSSSSRLKVGEYACYGSGGRIMIGLGFKVLAGNRYTDLEGGNPGSFVIAGDTVKFRGGHLGGQTGRDLRSFNFTIGANAGCEPF